MKKLAIILIIIIIVIASGLYFLDQYWIHRYDAVIAREAAHRLLAAARRKAELLRFARCAARRLAAQIDPTLGEGR